MIDSHCHLDHEPLLGNIHQVINNSKNVGVEKLLTICTTKKSFENIIKILKFDEMIYGTFGIHPHEADKDIVDKAYIKSCVKSSSKIIGVGETGLDFFYNNSQKIRQIESFEEHIKAAIELNIPIIVHSRMAETETFDLLNRYKSDNLKILMHCFTGSKEFAHKLLKLNCYFSASGIITFKNSNELQKTFMDIPINKLLIETDSPFLAPTPMRGKKNEPSFIKFTAEKLSDIKNTTFENIKFQTTNNFNNLFL